MAEQVVTSAPRRGRLIGEEPVAPTAGPIDFVSEDDLDWAENQSRPRHDATRLDAAFIGLAIMLTAVVIAVAIGLFSRF